MAAPERSRRRLAVLHVLVLSLLLTLGGRLWYLQVLAGSQYQQAAASNRLREIVTPAPRGYILDDRGVPLVRNEVALVVSVSRSALLRQQDRGRDLLRRVATVTGQSFEEVWGRTRLCGDRDAPPAPRCWNGSPYQPIPVTDEASPQVALQILERKEDFPGVTAELTAQRHYPGPAGVNAAHLLGYVGPVTDAELAARQGQPRPDTELELQRADLVGKAGLEKQYDNDLRGVPGVRELAVDHQGGVTGTVGQTEPTPGNHLVTSIDAKVQAVVERELADTILRARTVGDVNRRGVTYEADSGAAVVLDVRTGRVVAAASYPTYDPKIWVGGIRPEDYAQISSPKSNYPMIFRPTQAEVAPASTFKVVSLPAAVQAGYPLDGRYNCSSSYRVGNRSFQNYESRSYGEIDLERAINVSCDTIFYRFAHELWQRDGGSTPVEQPRDDLLKMARSYGFGQLTGIDLPGERGGRIVDREEKERVWRANKDRNCAVGPEDYADLERTDPERARYLVRLARENCLEGNQYRAGDAVNFAIGQGDTVVTPLQLARAYAAIANGGTLWVPQVAKAIISPTGQVVRTFEPQAAGTLPVRPEILSFLQRALRSTSVKGSARGPFLRAKFPLDRIPVAAKTGTGEVYGKQNTSWFASYAPADKPQFAVVMMISQGGTGSGTSGFGVAGIYKALFGVDAKGQVDPKAAVLAGSKPPAGLPRVSPDGTLLPPTPRKRRATPSPVGPGSPQPQPRPTAGTAPPVAADRRGVP